MDIIGASIAVVVFLAMVVRLDLAILVTVYFLAQVSLMTLGILVYKTAPASNFRPAPSGYGQ